MSKTSSSTAHDAADMTRRMVCGGLAGMIAKVSGHFLGTKLLLPRMDIASEWHSILNRPNDVRIIFL